MKGGGARTESEAVVVDQQYFRIFLGEPGRRSCRGRAQNDGNVVSVNNRDGPVQPLEVEAAFLRFHERPGKFGNTHVGNAHRRHGGGILLP